MINTRILLFRENLLQSIGFSKVNPKAIKLLQENIYDTTGLEIGYNTLRRFFGLLKETTPSLKTWKILHIYLRENEGSNTINTINFIDSWLSYNTFYLLISENNLPRIIHYLDSQKNNQQFPIMLGMYTNQLILNKDYDTLEKLYQSKVLANLPDIFLNILGEIVSSYLKSIPLQEIDNYIPILSIEQFKQAIFYNHIDYTNINKYYGYCLKAFKSNSFGENLFIECILGYNAYLNGKNLEVIKKLDISELENLYPVLVGRYIGYQILSYPNESDRIINYYIKPLIKTMNSDLLFLEIFPALILIKDFRSIQQIFNQYYEQLYEIRHSFSYIPMSIYLIAEALMYYYEDNLKSAQVVAKSINTQYISSSYYHYILLFKYILDYQLAETETEKQHILKQQNKAVAITGFKRFSKDFVINYFTW